MAKQSFKRVLKSSRHSHENIYSVNYCMLFFQPPEVISYDFSPKDVLFPVSLPGVIPMSRQWGIRLYVIEKDIRLCISSEISITY